MDSVQSNIDIDLEMNIERKVYNFVDIVKKTTNSLRVFIEHSPSINNEAESILYLLDRYQEFDKSNNLSQLFSSFNNNISSEHVYKIFRNLYFLFYRCGSGHDNPYEISPQEKYHIYDEKLAKQSPKNILKYTQLSFLKNMYQKISSKTFIDLEKKISHLYITIRPTSQEIEKQKMIIAQCLYEFHVFMVNLPQNIIDDAKSLKSLTTENR